MAKLSATVFVAHLLAGNGVEIVVVVVCAREIVVADAVGGGDGVANEGHTQYLVEAAT